MEPKWLDHNTWPTERWKTAIARPRYAATAIRLALENGVIHSGVQTLDFGCGKQDDVNRIRAKGFKAVGFDPYWQNDLMIVQRTDIIACVMVLNTIETEDERRDVLRYCWDLCKRSLILSVRNGKDKEEYTSISTYQRYYSQKSWEEFVQSALPEAGLEFPGAGIAFAHRTTRSLSVSKDTNKRYNSSVIKESNTMNNFKQVFAFLSTPTDKEADGSAPLFLSYARERLTMTCQSKGMMIKSSIPFSSQESWSIMIDQTKLLEVLSNLKASNKSVDLNLKSGNLRVTVGESSSDIDPWMSRLDFDLGIELDTECLEFEGKFWKEIDAAASVAASNKADVEPAIAGKGIRLSAVVNSLTVTGFGQKVSCHRAITLNHEIKSREFILPIEVVSLITDRKGKKTIRIELDYKFERCLISVDDDFFILTDLLQGYFPVFDGIVKQDDETSIVLNRKELQAALETAIAGGAQMVNILCENQQVIIQSKGNKTVLEPAETPQSIFTTTIKVAASTVLDAIRTISAAKVVLAFASAGNVLIVETFTGIIYVFLVVVKVAAHLAEVAKDKLKSAPERKQIAAGRNGDGSEYVIEAVESAPAEVTEVNPGDVKQALEGAKDAIHLIEDSKSSVELDAVKQELETLIERSEEIDQGYENQFKQEELREIAIELLWTKNRAIRLALCLEEHWHLEVKIIDPTK